MSDSEPECEVAYDSEPKAAAKEENGVYFKLLQPSKEDIEKLISGNIRDVVYNYQ